MKAKIKWRYFLTAFLLIIACTALVVTEHVAYFAHADTGGNSSSAIPGSYFAPYIDISADTGGKTLAQLSQASGVKYFTLAFIVAANSGCTPEWGGANVTLANDNNSQNGTGVIANTVKQQIADLQSAGGNAIISFGGEVADEALGGDLAQACTSTTALEKAYQSVVDHYAIDHIDFDIEGTVSTDLAVNARRDQAIKQLVKAEKSKGTDLSVSFTVPVLTEGLVNSSSSAYPSDGLDVVKSAITNQVPVSIFNIMTMYYGSECSNCDMGKVAGQTADVVVKQLSGFYTKAKQTLTQSQLYSKIGITPIIDNPSGVVPSENSISTSGAQELLTYAESKQIGELSIWTFNRDMEEKFAYSNILAAFPGNQCTTPTPDATDTSSTPDATATSDTSSTPDATATSDTSSTPDATATSDTSSTPDATATSDTSSTPDATSTSDTSSTATHDTSVTPTPCVTPPLCSTPVASATPDATMTPDTTATPDTTTTATPDATVTPGTTATPDTSTTPDATATPDTSTTPTSCVTPIPCPTPPTPAANATPAAIMPSNTNATPAAIITPAASATPDPCATSTTCLTPTASTTPDATMSPDISTTPDAIIAPTATKPITYPHLASAYKGKILNGNLAAKFTLTSIKEDQQGNISGNAAGSFPLCGSGSFTGKVNIDNSITFMSIATPADIGKITFTGVVNPHNLLSGNYTTSNGQTGTWQVRATS